MLLHGFHFHRTPLSRFFTLFPFRPQTLLTRHTSPAKHITYWHRPHTSTTKLPIVFIHGIGIGLYPYTNFLSELNSTAGVETNDPNEQVGIIAIEIMPVSFRITHRALGRETMCDEINQVITKEFGSHQKFVLVSHSYGTVVTTHLLKTPAISERIGPIVLIDPVSILLHLPDVAYNFTRRQPRHANEHQLYYFASMDMGVSHTLSRHFFWNENVLWKQDVHGRKLTVSLSGQDLIVDTEAVGRYLSGPPPKLKPASGYGGNGRATGSLIDIDDNGHATGSLIDIDDSDSDASSSLLRLRGREDTEDSLALIDDDDEEWKTRSWTGQGIDVLWFKDLDHAQVFDKPSTRMRVISAIRTYCEDVE
jgi:pimeloyl-ACP methyl ester carboxylesterase